MHSVIELKYYYIYYFYMEVFVKISNALFL